jgi:hypothetical protein
MELASCQLSGAWNFGVGANIFGEICAPLSEGVSPFDVDDTKRAQATITNACGGKNRHFISPEVREVETGWRYRSHS